MAFCRLHDEYWAVNLENLVLDTLSNTETSTPCIISKYGLIIADFYRSKYVLSKYETNLNQF